jgi:hypothetical protein
MCEEVLRLCNINKACDEYRRQVLLQGRRLCQVEAQHMIDWHHKNFTELEKQQELKQQQEQLSRQQAACRELHSNKIPEATQGENPQTPGDDAPPSDMLNYSRDLQ